MRQTTLTAPPTAGRDTDADEVLVAAARGGDDRALDALLTRYRPLVRGQARRYFMVGGDRQDVLQEGMIGLYKAIRDFDAARQPTFRHFAELCVTRQIISAVKAATRHKHAPLNTYVSLHTPPAHGDDEGGELVHRLADDDADPAAVVLRADDVAAVRAACAEVLSDLEGEVLRRYAAGESYAEIAAAVGRHTKAVDNAIQRIKRKLDGVLRGA